MYFSRLRVLIKIDRTIITVILLLIKDTLLYVRMKYYTGRYQISPTGKYGIDLNLK